MRNKGGIPLLNSPPLSKHLIPTLFLRCSSRRRPRWRWSLEFYGDRHRFPVPINLQLEGVANFSPVEQSVQIIEIIYLLAVDRGNDVPEHDPAAVIPRQSADTSGGGRASTDRRANKQTRLDREL